MLFSCFRNSKNRVASKFNVSLAVLEKPAADSAREERERVGARSSEDSKPETGRKKFEDPIQEAQVLLLPLIHTSPQLAYLRIT